MTMRSAKLVNVISTKEARNIAYTCNYKTQIIGHGDICTDAEYVTVGVDNGRQYIDKQKIIPGKEYQCEGFGYAVCVAEQADILAISAPFTSLKNIPECSGMIFIYKREDDGEYMLYGASKPPLPVLHGYGSALSLSGDGKRIAATGHNGDDQIVTVSNINSHGVPVGEFIVRPPKDSINFGDKIWLSTNGNCLAVMESTPSNPNCPNRIFNYTLV